MNKKTLVQLKCYLKEKEQRFLNSQIIQQKIESQLNKLNAKKQKIIQNKESVLSKVISFLLYDIIILTILYLFISNIIIRVTTPLTIYCGVISISLLWAYVFSKIENIIKKHYNEKLLQSILKKTKENEHQIKLETEKQQMIKQEISKMIGKRSCKTVETCSNEYNYENMTYYENYMVLPKIRSKKQRQKH